jgi:hypothetical protein
MFICKTCSAHLVDDLHDKSCPFCGEQFGPVKPRAASSAMPHPAVFALKLCIAAPVLLFCVAFVFEAARILGKGIVGS